MSVPVYREPIPSLPSRAANSRQNVVFVIVFGHGITHRRGAGADFVETCDQAIESGFVVRIRGEVPCLSGVRDHVEEAIGGRGALHARRGLVRLILLFPVWTNSLVAVTHNASLASVGHGCGGQGRQRH